MSPRKAIKQRADKEWNAIESEVDPRIHARRHLAEMPAERRAQLKAEWSAS